MTTEQKPAPKRMKLTIIKLGDKKEGVSKATGKPWASQPFQARTEDGQELWFSTFRTSLFDHIKPEAVIEADVEVKEDERGTTRNVGQLYENGQPVGGQAGGFGGKQWTPRGQSPEDRTSIEAQVGIKEIGEAIRADVKTIPADLVPLYWDWIRAKVRAVIAPSAPPPKAPPSATAAGPVATNPPVASGRKFANIGAVLQQANELGGMDKAACMAVWRKTWPEITDVAQIKNLEAAWTVLVKAEVVPE